MNGWISDEDLIARGVPPEIVMCRKAYMLGATDTSDGSKSYKWRSLDEMERILRPFGLVMLPSVGMTDQRVGRVELRLAGKGRY